MENEERIKQLEAELQHATNLLSEYKKQHEEFILIASHDLQAPLRKLTTFIDRLTLKFKDLPQEAKSYTERIQTTITNMRSIIDGLADLSTATEMQDNFRKCDLNELLRNVLKDIQPEDNFTFTCAQLPVIEGNCTQLKHLFQNLLDNAIKFKKKDIPLQIIISSDQINAEEKNEFNLSTLKTYYKIEIRDNGIGFEDQYSSKIFEPFQRLHGKSEYEGNGLGLAICKKIIENHKGILYAKGEKNSGAQFILILPETAD